MYVILQSFSLYILGRLNKICLAFKGLTKNGLFLLTGFWNTYSFDHSFLFFFKSVHVYKIYKIAQ